MTDFSGVLGVIAECRTCGWSSEARNALGNARRHATAHGHHVVVEQTISVSYNDPRGTDEQGRPEKEEE